jgi:hypothetical protein
MICRRYHSCKLACELILSVKMGWESSSSTSVLSPRSTKMQYRQWAISELDSMESCGEVPSVRSTCHETEVWYLSTSADQQLAKCSPLTRSSDPFGGCWISLSGWRTSAPKETATSWSARHRVTWEQVCKLPSLPFCLDGARWFLRISLF